MTILDAIKAARVNGDEYVYLPQIDGQLAERVYVRKDHEWDDASDLTLSFDVREDMWYESYLSVSDLLRTDWVLDDPTKGK